MWSKKIPNYAKILEKSRFFEAPVDALAVIRKYLSKTPLLNPFSEERSVLENDSDAEIEIEPMYDVIEIARNVEKYGPADPGIELSMMPRLVIRINNLI